MKTKKQRAIEWFIRQEIRYNIGKTKSRIGYLRDAVAVGGVATSLIQQNWAGFLYGLGFALALVPICWTFGFLWIRSGANAYELEYASHLNPVFVRLDKGRKEKANP